jgi:hypothetical protein
MYKEYKEVNGQEFKITVDYNKGGINYFSGNTIERGYYLNVTPVKREHKDGYTTETFAVFSGISKFLLPVARQSSKQLDKAIESSKSYIDELINHLISKTIRS